MAPKKPASASRGQRSITAFFPGNVTPGSSKAGARRDAGEGPSPPPSKRPRTENAADDAEAAAAEPSPAPTAAPAPRVPPACGSAADPARARQLLQHKLGLEGERAAAASGARQAIEPPQLTGEPAGPGGAPKLTPLEQQVVALKQRHPGVLLCIEVGYKFLFYGQDAEIASRELGVYAYQDRAFLSAGFPVPRLHVHVKRLVLAGHKVGVVRQVETAAIKRAGDNRSGPFERKLTALYTRATLEAGELGGLSDNGGDEAEEEEGQAEPAAGAGAAGPGGSEQAAAVEAPRRQAGWRRRRAAQQQFPPPPSSYLVCCVEEPAQEGSCWQEVEVGVVAVEPSTGTVLHAQFRDGLMRQELEGKLLFASPGELLLAQPASGETKRLAGAIGEQLPGAAPRLESVPSAKYKLEGSALQAVLAFYGSTDQEGGGSSSSTAGAEEAARVAALEAVHALPPLVLRALAHLLDYLRPFGLQAVLRQGASFQQWATVQEMRLSANTLRQLEVFRSIDGGPKGSLVSVMDHTKTAFGRRLLHSWVGKPLRCRAAILARLDAVQELAEKGGEGHPVLSQLVPALRKLPDLERGITRALHGTIRPSDLATQLQHFSELGEQLGLAPDSLQPGGGSPAAAVVTRAADDSEAEGGAEAASSAEEGGSGAAQLPASLRGVQSQLLVRLLLAAADPCVAAACRQMLDAMDLQAAAANDRANTLKPSPRFPEVLRWRDEAAAAERALDDLLPHFRRLLQLSSLSYQTLQNQGEYLVEVPPDLVKRVPKDWLKVSSVKKGVRYHPPEVKAGLARLALAREHLKAACDAAWKRFLSDFAQHYPRFRAAVQALAALDCLCSLAALASSAGYCRPQLVDEGEPAQLHIEGGRHPVLELLLEGRGQQFVPNDTHLQGDGVRCQVITGPNMGGKSCYSRQCALIAIMAQVGSYVPAAAVRLRPLDGVFTRMGASDSLALGRSTFAEELGEASSIVSSATASSLVILDELGRGTSTGDGAAIAEATLRYLATRTQPLTLFITHYPEVCFRLQEALPRAVACYRMAHVEEEGPWEQEGQQAQQQAHTDDRQKLQEPQQQGEREAAALGRVVFLFKLVPGVAPASFGINVARMAQLPPSVLTRAAQVAALVQEQAEQRRQQQAGQDAAGGSSSSSSDEDVVQLARQCQQFLQRSLAAQGQLDAEGGRQLQEQARQLLAAASS